MLLRVRVAAITNEDFITPLSVRSFSSSAPSLNDEAVLSGDLFCASENLENWSPWTFVLVGILEEILIAASTLKKNLSQPLIYAHCDPLFLWSCCLLIKAVITVFPIRSHPAQRDQQLILTAYLTFYDSLDRLLSFIRNKNVVRGLHSCTRLSTESSDRLFQTVHLYWKSKDAGCKLMKLTPHDFSALAFWVSS